MTVDRGLVPREALRALLAFLAACVGLILSAPTLVLGLPILFVASVTRVLGPPIRRLIGTPTVVPWTELMEYEPEVGWKPLPNLRVWAKADEPFFLTTDSDGWRGSTLLAESEGVVFGDSFAFGFGVSDGKVFADLVPGFRVKSIGANGYNMLQSLFWMERLAGELNGKVVIWLLYYANDLFDNLQPSLDGYRTPFVRRTAPAGNWEVVNGHVGPEPWRFPREKHDLNLLMEICSRTELSERAFDACDFILGESVKICDHAGAQLVVLGAPDESQLAGPGRSGRQGAKGRLESYDPLLPDHRLDEICQARHVRFVPLSDHLTSKDYLKGDCHWNARGHRKVAELLGRIMREEASHTRSSDGRSAKDARVAPLDVRLA